MNHFKTTLLLDPYFKINDWIYSDILGVLVNNSLNLTSFHQIPPNLTKMKIWDFEIIEKNDCSLLIIPFPPTKTSKQRNEHFNQSIKTSKQGNGIRIDTCSKKKKNTMVSQSKIIG